MEWKDVVERHWDTVEIAAKEALILIKEELHEIGSSLAFDDRLKQLLLCRSLNG